MTVLIIAGVIGAIIYFWYAGIIGKRNKAREALSGIDVQLKKRHNLIPNILKIAKKFMEHEKSLIEEVTKLRTQATAKENVTDAQGIKEKFNIEAALQGKMGQLMIAVEAYPDLTSSQPITQAMQTYNEVEEHIAAARRFYNAAVTALRNSIQIFPGNLIAKLARAEDMPLFEADKVAKKSVNADDYLK